MKAFPIALLLLLAAASVSGDIAETANIQVTMVNQEPYPVEPGENLVLRFRAENRGSFPANDVSLQLQPSFPFSLAPDEGGGRFLGTLAGRQTGNAGVIVSYNVLVDSRASEGVKEVYLVQSGQQVQARIGPFNVTVRPRQAVVSITGVESSPDVFMPGQEGNITIEVQNSAGAALRNVLVKLGLSSETIPFAPSGNSQYRSVRQLQPGEKASLAYGLAAEPGAAAGLYKIPVTISYSDAIGKNYTADDIISVRIGGKPVVNLHISEQDTLSVGKTGKITVQVTNSGLIDAKLASLGIKPGAGYEIISPATAYIGKLDSDDYDTATFKLYISAARLKIPATVTFMDGNNNQYSEDFILEPKVYTDAEARKYGFSSGGFLGFAVAAAIIIIGLVAYRQMRRR
ncbi:hypothetical protein HYY74_06260 [Candidatus Woesearchaeota archaeon]|nr:hypothetical protein [Candidatus Woesearchaeota archaeon]